MTIRSIIFDFDGTILDTESPEYHAWKYVFQQFNLDLPLDTWAVALGTKEEHFDGCSIIEKSTSNLLDRDNMLDQKNKKAAELLSEQEILPGVFEHLSRAKSLGLKLGIASSSNRAWVIGHLKRLGVITYFDVITASDDVLRTKPAPDLYLRCLGELECDSQDTLAYEDSPNGILAASAAGIKCIAIPNPISVKMNIHIADLVIDSLATTSLDDILRIFSR